MPTDTLNDALLRTLASIETEPVVSVYLPTIGRDGDPKQPAIRLKNLVREAASRLSDSGKPRSAASRWMEPVAALAEDETIWQRRGEGIAIFRWRAQLCRLDLWHEVDEQLHVGTRVCLLPLLEPQLRQGRFALLAFSGKRVRLLVCSRRDVARLEGEQLPESYESALGKYVDTERQLQYHSGASHAGGARAPIYHGQGVAGDRASDTPRRTEFCRAVDRGVRQLLGDSDLPLVLAADVPLAAAYRRANRYHPLLQQTLAGNFDHLSDAALRDKALPLIDERIAAAQTEVIRRYRETPPDGTARSLEDVLTAAADGRIDTLLVRRGAQQWGRYHEHRDEPRTAPAHEREELINLAACRTLSAGGDVLVLDGDRVPTVEPVCAVLRY